MACYANIIYGPSADSELLAVPVAVNPVTNVILPTTGKPRLQLRTVYADDGVTVSYYEYTLSVDTQIYANTAVATDPGVGVTTVENEVTRIRNILATPGLKLVISPVGLGTFPVVNGDPSIVYNVKDLVGGPFPESVTVEPIVTNNLIGISWVIKFCISHCPPGLVKNFVQFNSELDVTIDEEGWLQFSINCHYQTVDPLTSLTSITPLVEAIAYDVLMSFQGMHITKRTSQSRDKRMTHITVTAKEIKSDSPFFPYTKNISVQDSISSSLFETDATKGAGFQTWERNIAGSITLPRRVSKLWAWAVFAAILKERFVGMTSLTKIPTITTFTTTPGQANPATTKVNLGSFLLTEVKMVNHLYSQKIDFDFSYLVTMNLLDLVAGGANFFYNVRSNVVVNSMDGSVTIEHRKLPNNTNNPDWPGNNPVPANTKSNEWFIWHTYNTQPVNSWLGYNSNGPIVMAQCMLSPGVPIVPASEKLTPTVLLNSEKDQDYTPVESNAAKAAEAENIKNITKQRGDDTVVDNRRKSWVDYKYKLTIIEENHNSLATYLQDNNKVYFQADAAAAATNDMNAFTIDNRSGNPEVGMTLAETFVHSNSTYKIRLTGYAIRVGEKIPVPAIISVGGVPVARSGEARYEYTTLVNGSSFGTSDYSSDGSLDTKLPVYMCQWDITYNVDTNLKGTSTTDILTRLMTSGDPAHYV
jgi:hypothetical protein